MGGAVRRAWAWLKARNPSARYFLLLSLVAVPVEMFVTREPRSQVPTIKGLPPAPRATALAYLDPEALNGRLREAHRAEFTPVVRCRRLGLLTLGLTQMVEPPTNLAPTGWIERFAPGRGVGGFYLPGSDTLFLPSSAPGDPGHEMVHAYEDQVGRRMRVVPTTTDEAMALRAVVEGTAVMASHGTPIRAPLSGDLDHDALVLAYGIAPTYVQTASGGDVAKALELQPKTTAAILFPLADQPPADIQWPTPAMAPGERLLCTDAVGALGLLAALESQNATLPLAQMTATGWRGDRVSVIDSPTGVRAVWDISFADSAAARAWNATVVQGLRRTHSQVAFVTRVAPPVPPQASPLDALGK